MRRNIKRIAMGILGALLAALHLPVCAAGQAHPRILQLQMGQGQTSYSVYFAAKLEDALFGHVQISREPAQEELERILRPENLVAEVVTDGAGEARLDCSEAGLEDGVYLITGEGCEAFYVCIPEPDGDYWNYTVQVYPGYRIGGEAELPPSGRATTRLTPEQARRKAWDLEAVVLLASVCTAAVVGLLRAPKGKFAALARKSLDR